MVTGNAWSLFTKMKGGRSVLILYLSLVFWNPIVWIFVVTIPLCSMLMNEDTAPFVALALILLPIIGYGDLTTQALLGLLVCVMLSKRVTANQILKLPQMNMRLLFNRLLFDRDNV
jgi:cell division protein FtsW (lipid II flippase)